MNSNSRVQRRNIRTLLVPLLAVVWLLAAIVYNPDSLFPRPAAQPIMEKDEPVRDAVGALPATRITVLHAAPPLDVIPETVVARKRAAKKKSGMPFPRPVMKTAAPKPVVERPAAPAKGTFTVRGSIFDLMTLTPVSGAEIRFKDGDTEKQVSVATDEKGRYKISLKSNGTGYALSIRHPRYSKRGLEDWGVSFRSMSRAQREQAASDHLARQTKTIILSMPGQVIEQDYAVLPLRRSVGE